MALKNCIYGTYPAVVHLPGMSVQGNWRSAQLFESLSAAPLRRISVPSGLSVVTWNSRPNKTRLERQCAKLGVKLTVLGRKVRRWNNGMKGALLVEFSKSSGTEFVLAADATDAVIQGDLNVCVAELERAGCEVLFGAEPYSAPAGTEAYRDFEMARYTPPFRFLNAGLMIGRCSFVGTLTDVNWDKSDQKTWRGLHKKFWPRIKIDDGCRVFQNIATHPMVLPDRAFSVVFSAPRAEAP